MTTAYHGTPITPEAVLLAIAEEARHFCVSFYRPDQIELVAQVSASFFIDNGAFSAWRKGLVLDAVYWARYWLFVATWLARGAAWFVIPDVIDAGSQLQDAMLKEAPSELRPWAVPVWHMDEPISRLVGLTEEYQRVAVGSTGDFAVVGSPAWRIRMDAVFDTLCPGGGKPPVPIHMLRGLQCELPSFDYPFETVDSTHLGRNHNRLNRYGPRKLWAVRQFADRWYRLNCPEVWMPRAKEPTLFAA